MRLNCSVGMHRRSGRNSNGSRFCVGQVSPIHDQFTLFWLQRRYSWIAVSSIDQRALCRARSFSGDRRCQEPRRETHRAINDTTHPCFQTKQRGLCAVVKTLERKKAMHRALNLSTAPRDPLKRNLLTSGGRKYVKRFEVDASNT